MIVFAAFSLTGCDVPAAPPAVATPSDAEIVKLLHDRMAVIESAVAGDQQQVHDIAAAMRADRTQAARKMHLAMMDQMFQSLVSLLDAAATIKVPPMSNPDAARYASAMTDDHKQWAILQEARIGAMKSLDEKAFDTLSAQADHVAGQEALHMMMAYKAVNLPLE
jgi:hypothetical protein